MLVDEIKRININIGGKPSSGCSSRGQKVDEISNAISRPVFDDYIKFLSIADGGHPEIGSFLVPGGDDHNYFDVDHFYSLANQNIETIIHALTNWGKVLGESALPFARDGGGNQFYFNLEDKPPSVWIYIHDETKNKIKLANSFEAFLTGLHQNADFI